MAEIRREYRQDPGVGHYHGGRMRGRADRTESEPSTRARTEGVRDDAGSPVKYKTRKPRLGGLHGLTRTTSPFIYVHVYETMEYTYM